MADLVRSVVLRILGNNDDAKRAIDDTDRRVSALEKRRPTVSISADARSAAKTIDDTNRKLDILGRRSVSVTVRADDKQAKRSIDETNKSLDILGKKTDTAKVKVDNAAALAAIARVVKRLDAFGKIVSKAHVGLTGVKEANLELDKLEKRLRDYGKMRETAHVRVSGVESSILSVDRLIRKLDELDHMSASAKVGQSGLEIGTALASRGIESGGKGGGGSFLGKLMEAGGEGGKGAGGGGAGLTGIAGSGGVGVLGSVPGPVLGSVAAFLASLVPGLVGGGLGIGTGGALLGGQMALGQMAKQTLKLDATAAAKKQGPQASKNAQNKLAQDAKTLTPLMQEVDTAKGLLAPIEGVFIKLAGPVTKILSGLMPVAKQIAAALLTMFKASLPFLNQFLQALGPLAKALFPAIAQALRAMLPSFPIFLKALIEVVKGFALFIKVLGPGMRSSSGIFLIFAQLMKVVMVGIGVLMDGLAVSFHVLFTVFKVIWTELIAVVKIGWIILKGVFQVGIDLLSGHWSKAWKDIKQVGVAIWHVIVGAAKAIWGDFVAVFKGIVSALRPIWAPLWHGMKAVFVAAIDAIKIIGVAFWHFLVAVWHGITAGVSKAWHALTSGLGVAWRAVTGFISREAVDIWHFLVHTWNSITSGVSKAWHVLTSALGIAWRAVTGFIINTATTIWHGLVRIWNAIESGVMKVWHVLTNALGVAWRAVINFLTTAGTNFWHTIVRIWNEIWSGVMKAWHAMVGALTTVFKNVVSFISNAATGFWHFLVHTWNVIKDDITSIWHSAWHTMQDLAANVVNTIKGFASGFWHWLVGVWQAIKKDVGNVWHDMWQGLQNAAHNAVNTLIGIIRKIGNAFVIPIRFVIDKVWNPIARLWNKVTGAIGIHINLPLGPEIHNFAKGGAVPGPRGAGDVVPAMLTPGEHVLTTSQVAAAGGHQGVQQMFGAGNPGNDGTHFAGGGNVPGFNGGGRSATGKQGLQVLGGVTTSFNKGTGFFNPITSLLNLGKKLLDKVVGWSVGKIESAIFGQFLKHMPGGGVVWPVLKAMISKLIHGLAQKIFDQSAAASGSLGPYKNPLRKIRGLQPERIDMGVDYAGSGPVFALGPGVIVNTAPSGWPGLSFINERLTAGAFAGKYWYSAENIRPKVHVGQHVNANTVIGELINASPHSEFGWASGHGTGTMAAALHQQAGGDPGGHTSAMGDAANRLLVALGAPSGIRTSRDFGKIPKGFELPKAGGKGLVGIARYLMSRGYNRAAAAGMAGLVAGEAGPSANPETMGSGGAGLIGWTPPSAMRLVGGTCHAAGIGHLSTAQDMANQERGMVLWASKNGFPPRVANRFKNPVSAAYAASAAYERPAVRGSDVHPTYINQVFRALAKGGILREPVAGFGLHTGTNYLMGEAGDEAVIPLNKLHSGGGSRGGDVYNIYPPDSATNPDAYGLKVIQAIRDYKRHHGNQATGIG